jgi:hypothetical protein
MTEYERVKVPGGTPGNPIQVKGKFYFNQVDDQHFIWEAPFEVKDEMDELKARTYYAHWVYTELREREKRANRINTRFKVPNRSGRYEKRDKDIVENIERHEKGIRVGFGSNGARYRIRFMNKKFVGVIIPEGDIVEPSIIEAKTLREMSIKLKMLKKESVL